MKRKVAIIDPLGAHGSSHHLYLFGQAMGLINSGIDVRLYTNNETENPKIKGLKFHQLYNNLFTSKSRFFSGIKYILGSILSIVHARITGHKLIHFHIFYANILVLFNVVFSKILFGKVVLTVHDVNSFAANSDHSLLIYKLSDAIITHNEFSKTELVTIQGALNKKISIIPHGNYIPFIQVQKNQQISRERLGIPQDKKVLLFFGMIKRVKGLEVLLRALIEVKQQQPDVILLVAGKVWENDFTPYQKIIDENNLQEFCLLHTKFIPQEDVAHYYCASDLVVLPYKEIYQSGVLMMTLSYEKPALVSNLPPLKEVIKDNENGFLFESENSSSLAEKINCILSDEKQWEIVRKNGAELIKTAYSWDEIGKQTKEAYQTL
jgi:glycosyltransferase involved in cell wall biosynthesis